MYLNALLCTTVCLENLYAETPNQYSGATITHNCKFTHRPTRCCPWNQLRVEVDAKPKLIKHHFCSRLVRTDKLRGCGVFVCVCVCVRRGGGGINSFAKSKSQGGKLVITYSLVFPGIRFLIWLSNYSPLLLRDMCLTSINSSPQVQPPEKQTCRTKGHRPFTSSEWGQVAYSLHNPPVMKLYPCFQFLFSRRTRVPAIIRHYYRIVFAVVCRRCCPCRIRCQKRETNLAEDRMSSAALDTHKPPSWFLLTPRALDACKGRWYSGQLACARPARGESRN